MTLQRILLINSQFDIVTARMRGREIARFMGFGPTDQARISLAISELARVLSRQVNRQGEIIISNVAQNGQTGLEISCLVTREFLPKEDRWSEWSEGHGVLIHSLSGACQLMDTSVMEAQSGQQARVTLTKWMSQKISAQVV